MGHASVGYNCHGRTDVRDDNNVEINDDTSARFKAQIVSWLDSIPPHSPLPSVIAESFRNSQKSPLQHTNCETLPNKTASGFCMDDSTSPQLTKRYQLDQLHLQQQYQCNTPILSENGRERLRNESEAALIQADIREFEKQPRRRTRSNRYETSQTGKRRRSSQRKSKRQRRSSSKHHLRSSKEVMHNFTADAVQAHRISVSLDHGPYSAIF